MSLAWQPLPALEWLETKGGPLCAAAAPRLRALLLSEVSSISCFLLFLLILLFLSLRSSRDANTVAHTVAHELRMLKTEEKGANLSS